MMGRVNIGGSTSYRAARVRTSTVLVVSVAAAAVYLFLTGLSPFTRLPFRPAVVVVPVFMGIITLVLMSQGTLSNERYGWLSRPWTLQPTSATFSSLGSSRLSR